MERRAQDELVHLFRDAISVGGAAIEMRLRRFASYIRPTDEGLADAIAPLVTGATRSLRRDQAVPLSPTDSDTKLSLVRTEAADVSREKPVLSAGLEKALDQVVRERRAADKLTAAGLMPCRSILMSGPPGVGKTMTAGWLAGQLNVPLLTLDLASVMSSFLGKTGANLRAVLNHAQEQPCVLLLDEFDAIAKRRDDDTDVGELKRLVTVILQTIDDWSPLSLLVAATNHGELLDPAVWRRFDVTLTFELPDAVQRQSLLALQGLEPSIARAIAAVTEGQTFSALSRAIHSARKQNVLDGKAFVDALVEWAVFLNNKLASSRQLKRARRDLQVLLLNGRDQTTREIAQALGVTHTTVIRTLKQFEDHADVRP